MPFGRWFYYTEQLTQSEPISHNFSIFLLIRDFIKKSFSNVQKFSDIQFLSPMAFYEGV